MPENIYYIVSFVSAAIVSSTLFKMLKGCSYTLTLELVDEFVWPEGITKTDVVKAIGNSVSCGLAEAITLACLSQQEDISGFFETKTAAA